MRIIFTRHGESEANIQGIISNRDLPHKLTPIGVCQSLTLSESLFKWKITKVITCPIIRSKETANIIAEKLNIPIIVSPALREFDCGGMEGRKDDDAWLAHQIVTRAWDEKRDFDCRIMPDGESFNDMKARFLPLLANIIEEKEHHLGDVLLVSHGGMLHQMLPLVMASVDRAFQKQHPIGNCELVITHPQNKNLVCVEWAGIKMV